MSDANNSVSMLMDMGFEADKAQEALRVCGGNMERAVEYLFSGGGGAPADPPTSSSAGSNVIQGQYQDVVAPISQYSVDNGRSACTCIALTAAEAFLQHPQGEMKPEFWVEAIQKGVLNYETLQQASSNGVEHMSAEEVLKVANESTSTSTALSTLTLTHGGIRQGILSNTNPRSDMGLHTLLTACRQEAPTNAWLAVLITKTPETVLAILPPPSSNATSGYMVIDSHPRPGVVQGGGAYVRKMASLDDIVAHLSTILPATELGPDIPEMMAMMYNSFDLYPLVLKK